MQVLTIYTINNVQNVNEGMGQEMFLITQMYFLTNTAFSNNTWFQVNGSHSQQYIIACAKWKTEADSVFTIKTIKHFQPVPQYKIKHIQNGINHIEKYTGPTYMLVVKKIKSVEAPTCKYTGTHMRVHMGRRQKGFGQQELSKAASASCGLPDQDG